MLRVLPPTVKPVLSQTKLLQVVWILSSDWMKLRGSHTIDGNCVTCCETSLPWAGKTHNIYRFFTSKSFWCKKYKYSLLSARTGFVASRQVDSWVVKPATSLFIIAKQVARFCCPFYRIFRLWSTSILGSRDLSCTVSGFDQVLKVTRGGFKRASCLRLFVK